MKKLIALVLAAMMLLGMTALAEAPVNLGELSDADLMRLYNLCASEIALRTAAPEQVWFQSEDGSVTILVTGMTMSSLNKVELQLDYQILNGSAEKVSFKVANLVINGWACDGSSSRAVEGGTNLKKTLQLSFLSFSVGWETPKQAAEEIKVAKFDLVVSIGSEKITIPMVITDFSGLEIENR